MSSLELLQKTRELFNEAAGIKGDKRELYVDGFDAYGIWSQMQLFDTEWIDEFVQERLKNMQGDDENAADESDDEQAADTDAESGVEYSEHGDESLGEFDEFEEYERDEENNTENLEEIDEGPEEEIDEEMDMPDDDQEQESLRKPKRKRSIVDDEFFSLQDMEAFADMSEERDIEMSKMQAEDSDSETDENFSIGRDLAEGAFDAEDENANDVFYSDFFEPVQKEKKLRSKVMEEIESEMTLHDEEDFGEEEEQVKQKEEIDEHVPDSRRNLLDDEPEKSDEYLSTYEKQQRRIQREIEALEEENMAQKKWTLTGEASAKKRPVNSLLEEDLEFEQTAKPVPVVTEESTATLDDIIIQRIKDNAWDDVVRKAAPKNTPHDANRRFELQEEKSSKSLAQIYEEEYQKQTNKAFKSEKSEVLEKQHNEITTVLGNLFNQLDALSNYHCTPKAATMELTVIPAPNVPAISLEEAIPAVVSDATLATPKEVYDGKVAKSQAEMDKADKRKARVKAKLRVAKDKHARAKAKQAQEKETETQSRMTQKAAVKKLMGQANVTIIASNSKEKKEFGKGAATVIDKGGKVTQDKDVSRPEMLRL